MSLIHICNAFFEKELESPQTKPLANWLRAHPVISQLQFLPLLYAAKDDFILVSDLPLKPDPRLRLLDDPPKDCAIEHWGPSLAISAWAKKHNIAYAIPNWKIIQEINSKVFSFTHSPKLPGAALLENQRDAMAWMASIKGPKVFKTPFGTAGAGHMRDVKQLYTYPVIGEPWMERILDFSTQWKNGELLGATLFENEPNGTYKGTFLGKVEEWALEEHLAVATPLVEKIVQMGYSGNLGVDAFIYNDGEKKRLHPVVEINARKTMSWVALLTQKNLYYQRMVEGLLPNQLGDKNFARNICLSV